MKTYQISGKPDVLEFTNYDREDEEVLFRKIYSILENSENIVMGSKRIGPSEDFYECKIYGLPFTLIYDVDYGTSIKAAKDKTIQKLTEFFEETIRG